MGILIRIPIIVQMPIDLSHSFSIDFAGNRMIDHWQWIISSNYALSCCLYTLRRLPWLMDISRWETLQTKIKMKIRIQFKSPCVELESNVHCSVQVLLLTRRMGK